ncbi:MAG: Tn3 family transposase [Singulisphaera sp.]
MGEARFWRSRDAQARAIFHGQRGELRQRTAKVRTNLAAGQVINAVVLWNTRYLDAALAQVHAWAQWLPEDLERLSPLLLAHINVLGRYGYLKEPVR